MFRITVAATAVGAGLIFSGTVAHACSECPITAQKQAQPAPKAAPARGAKPARRPVATAAGRVVKTERGNYASALRSRPAKRQPVHIEYLPVVVSTEAEHAFAMTQAFAPPSVNVRTVPADEVNEIDLAANDSPIKPILVPTRVESAFAMMRAKDFGGIDSQAPARPSAAPATAACNEEAASASRDDSWLARMRTIVANAYAAMVASRSP